MNQLLVRECLKVRSNTLGTFEIEFHTGNPKKKVSQLQEERKEDAKQAWLIIQGAVGQNHVRCQMAQASQKPAAAFKAFCSLSATQLSIPRLLL